MQQPDVSAVLFVATHDAARGRFFSHDQTACSECFSRENSVALSRSVAQLQACARERGLDVRGRAGRLHGLDGPVDYTGADGMVGCSKGPGSNHHNRSSCVAQPLVARTAQSQGGTETQFMPLLLPQPPLPPPPPLLLLLSSVTVCHQKRTFFDCRWVNEY